MSDPSSPRTPPGHFIALIGDMVNSRSFSGEARSDIHDSFNLLIARLNRTYRSALSSRFTVTLGDEFQGLLHDAVVIPDILWEIERQDFIPHFRLGVGFGRVDTKIP